MNKSSEKSKPAKADFHIVFNALRGILKKHAKALGIIKDTKDLYYTNIKGKTYRDRPLAFAMVQIGKGYVSFHLLPVYMNPKLQAMISPELKKRMQGKACFNFKSVDKPLFKELEKLTATGLKMFQKIEDVEFG